MLLYLQAMLLNSVVGNLIVFVMLAITSYRFWLDLRASQNGMTKALLLFFAALTVDRLWSVGVATLAAWPVPGTREIMLAARGISLILIILAWFNLKTETQHE